METQVNKSREVAAEAILEGTGARVITFRMLNSGIMVTEAEWETLRDSGSLNEK